MKVAAQSEFYFQTYGPEEGIKRLEKLGYQYITYTITGRYDQPFTTQWTEKEIKEHYAPVGEALQKSNLEVLFAIVGTDIYNDVLHETFAARKKMCVHAVKAAAYAGCKIIAVRPATIIRPTTDAMGKSKAISLEVFDAMKEEADKWGIQLAFINNRMSKGFWGGNYCYGSNARDLMELAEQYDARIVIDPVYAYQAMERLEKLIVGVKDKLLGFLITDLESSTESPVIPIMGNVNYSVVAESLKDVSDEVALVVMCSQIFKRYGDFVHDEEFLLASAQLLKKMAFSIANKSKGL